MHATAGIRGKSFVINMPARAKSVKFCLLIVRDGLVEVLEGLDAGEKVVTAGNLLIDAETQISQSGN